MSGEITILGTFLAGIISFISPCVLPLVPPYLTYMAGVSLDELISSSERGTEAQKSIRRKTLVNSFFFVLGFTCVFVGLGASASSFSAIIRQHLDVFSTIAGIIIILMGCHFLGIFKIGLLYREARFQPDSDLVRSASIMGSFVMGLAFAFGWTPCITPILGPIISLASVKDTVGEGAMLLGVYSLGLAVPFMLAALFAGQFMSLLGRFRKHLGSVEKLIGVLLVLTGIAFLTGGMQWFSGVLLENFPLLQEFG